jgi:DNA polymerase/3'-5' exonuclease PolX
MNLAAAQPIAERVRDLLAPHCDRIEIAGSIRRQKAEVGDIEICAIPKTVQEEDLFGGTGVRRDPGFSQRVSNLGVIEAGDPTAGKYIKLQLPAGIQMDLFLATQDNWGWIFAIRTGSAEFSHRKLAAGLLRAGHKAEGGRIHRLADGAIVPLPEEADLFNLIGLPFIHPRHRNL